MKIKKIVIALIVSIFTVGSVMANEPVMAPKEISSSVAEIIQEKVYYPDFAIEDKFQGDVLVEVQITEEGSFDVIAANSVNKDLKTYATKTIENITAESFKNYAGQRVIVKINYNLLLY
ncbi:MAG: energy transducer TonB [Bacteroidetes bacterium]|nr:energy transducer TonB [Bacteroidota bacterium]